MPGYFSRRLDEMRLNVMASRLGKLRLTLGCFVLVCLIAVGCAVAEPPAEQVKTEDQLVPSNLPAGSPWKLVWSDEFNGNKLDRTKWDFRLHIMHQRFKTWTDDAASLDGKGNLLLKVYEKGGNCYSSQLQTGSNFMDAPVDNGFFRWPIAKIAPPKFMHKYGYYEIRCKLPKKSGWWPAFWLQSPTIGSSLEPAASGVEIDIMESFTRDGVIFHTIHWNGYGADHGQKCSGPLKRPELSEGYHTFGVDWNAKQYVFYIDGKETWRVGGPISNREQFILVSAECGGYRPGSPVPKPKKEDLPDYFVVDYVRVFDRIDNATTNH